MSTPQLEDGFTMIANELLEAILCAGLTANQWKVAMAIIRKTYGFNKAEDDLSASQIAEMCKLARPHVAAALNQLALRNIITKRLGRFGSIVGIQKDYRKWVCLEKLVSDSTCTDSVKGCTESVHVQNLYRGCTESVQSMCTESVHTKDNYPKDNHQKTSSCTPKADRDQVGETPAGRKGRAKTGTAAELAARFERFYAAYPRKKSRQTAEKAFAKLNPDDELLDRILASLEQAVKSGEWSDPQYIPYPASWLNAAGWLDEVQAAYSDVELVVIKAFNAALGAQLGDVSTSIFVPARAAAIREFTTFSLKAGFVERYFPWVRDTAAIPPHAGFDWIISRKGFADISSGQHARKAA